jgi:SAM-dependent methyltransferase
MPDRIEAFIASLGIAPDARVLEIGCGHGVAATLICGRLTTGRYTAIDRSETMIHAAARRNQAFVERGIAEFIVVDIETADLGARRFDVALAMRVRLFHVERPRDGPRAAMAGARRATLRAVRRAGRIDPDPLARGRCGSGRQSTPAVTRGLVATVVAHPIRNEPRRRCSIAVTGPRCWTTRRRAPTIASSLPDWMRTPGTPTHARSRP